MGDMMENKFETKTVVEAHLQGQLGVAVSTIKEAQGILLTYLLPDNEITAEATISELLSLLDNEGIVTFLKEVDQL